LSDPTEPESRRTLQARGVPFVLAHSARDTAHFFHEAEFDFQHDHLGAPLQCDYREDRAMKIAAVVGLLVLVLAQSSCGADDDRMVEIRALQNAGRFEDSIDELREVLAETPELPEASYRLGVALARTGNLSRSVWALEKASEASEFSIPANLQLASVQFGLNNFEESIRASDRVLAADPNHREALHLNAHAHVGARQLEEALIDTSHLLELDPDDYPILVVHATVLAELGRKPEAEAAHARIKQISAASGDEDRAGRGCLAPPLFAKDNLGDLERAEELYEDCASKYSGNRFVIGHIASFFDAVGKPRRATELMERAVAEAPDDLALRSALATRLARLGRAKEAESVLKEAVDRFGVEAAGDQLVRHYRRQRDPQRALAVIEEILDEAGDAGDQLQFIRADLLVDVGQLDRAEELANHFEEPSYTSMIRGRILLARGDAEAALAAFDEGIANWPGNAGARYLAGIAALQLGNFERAIVELRESVRVDDSATEAARILARLHFDRREYAEALAFSAIAQQHSGPAQRAEDLELDARALAALGEFDRAVELFDRAAGIDPGNEVYAYGAAQLVLAAGDRNAAEARLRAIVRRSAGHPEARNDLAWLLATERRDLDFALSLARDASRLRPESATLDTLGLVHIERGEVEEAVDALEKAIATPGASPTVHYHFAIALIKSKNTERAREMLKRALAGGDFPEAEAARQQLAELDPS
jgi:tetratricopeptide (TPR) repeat protein